MGVSTPVGYLFNDFSMLAQGYSDLNPSTATMPFDPMVSGSVNDPSACLFSSNLDSGNVVIEQ